LDALANSTSITHRLSSRLTLSEFRTVFDSIILPFFSFLCCYLEKYEYPDTASKLLQYNYNNNDNIILIYLVLIGARPGQFSNYFRWVKYYVDLNPVLETVFRKFKKLFYIKRFNYYAVFE